VVSSSLLDIALGILLLKSTILAEINMSYSEGMEIIRQTVYSYREYLSEVKIRSCGELILCYRTLALGLDPLKANLARYRCRLSLPWMLYRSCRKFE